MANKTFWLSFDLGIKGDYAGMYLWLDSHRALECGDSLALLKLDVGDRGFVNVIKEEIKKHVQLNNTDRMYLMWRDDKENKVKGRFLFGARRTPPWAGYAPKEDSAQEDSDI